MNTQYLFEHTASITGSSLAVFTRQAGGPVLLCRYGGADYAADAIPEEAADFFGKAAQKAVPSLASFDSLRYYAVIPQKDVVLFLGPVRLSAFLALKVHGTGTPEPKVGDAVCDIPVFLNTVLLLHNALSDAPISEQELMAACGADQSHRDVQKYNAALVYDNRENSLHHNPYSSELRLMGCIERGDLRLLEKCQKERITGSFGKLASSMERSVRNISIAAIALASRAAIRGGVNAEAAFSLCDSYIMKVEAIRDLQDLQPLVEGAQRNFASMVKRLKDENTLQPSQLRHPLVEKCKNYIYANLHGKITVADAAGKLNTNPNYLSTLFKRYEGISFSDYVMREKIALAKNLLIYSGSSYGQIAATLGFSSQSHMGKHFKEITGMTPIQFRKRYTSTEISD